MKTKSQITFILVVIVVLITISKAQLPQKNKDEERRGTIAWHVKQSKLKGKNKAKLLPMENTYFVVDGLDDALSQYTVVVAELIGRRSYVADEASLVTWNKFKVLEVLSQPLKHACPGCLSGLNVPPEMRPNNSAEILLPSSGGSVVVDGVDVEIEDRDFGKAFSPSQKFLLFLSLDKARSAGKITLGPYGVFAIDSGGSFQPITSVTSPLREELNVQTSDSLDRLREYVQRKR